VPDLEEEKLTDCWAVGNFELLRLGIECHINNLETRSLVYYRRTPSVMAQRAARDMSRDRNGV
jgi:hypothetical protein